MPYTYLEALEWAADYAERTKMFEIPPPTARERFEIVSGLAETVVAREVAPPAPPRRIALADKQCLDYIQYCTDQDAKTAALRQQKVVW
jgi:hypothetical protein